MLNIRINSWNQKKVFVKEGGMEEKEIMSNMNFDYALWASDLKILEVTITVEI